MIRYKKFQSTTDNATKDKWYPRAVPQEMVTLDGLSQHMASHNTPYSKGAIKGILTDMVLCIKELLLEGKSVKIEDLAIFTIALRAKGADSLEKFDLKTQLKGIHINARSCGILTPSRMELEVVFKELTTYEKPDA